MTLLQAAAVGIATDKMARKITRTNKVSVTRSAVATGSSSLMAGLGTSTVVVGAELAGATAPTAAAAPVIIPVSIAAGAIGLLCSLFE